MNKILKKLNPEAILKSTNQIHISTVIYDTLNGGRVNFFSLTIKIYTFHLVSLDAHLLFWRYLKQEYSLKNFWLRSFEPTK